MYPDFFFFEVTVSEFMHGIPFPRFPFSDKLVMLRKGLNRKDC